MSDLLHYKDYYGTVEYSAKDRCLFGKIVGINSLYMYEGNSIGELENDFHEMVDSYIDSCKEKGIEPDRAFKGSFNIRVSPAVHKAAALFAIQHGITLNSLVEKSLEQFINPDNLHFGMVACDNSAEYKTKKRKEYSL